MTINKLSNIQKCADRKRAILRIADNMAAASSTMNSQNYDLLIQSRNELTSLLELWEHEDNKTFNILQEMKKWLDSAEA